MTGATASVEALINVAAAVAPSAEPAVWAKYSGVLVFRLYCVAAAPQRTVMTLGNVVVTVKEKPAQM